MFYTNLLLIRTCGEKAEFGTISSGHEHFFPPWSKREQEKLIQGLLAPATLLDV